MNITDVDYDTYEQIITLYGTKYEFKIIDISNEDDYNIKYINKMIRLHYLAKTIEWIQNRLWMD